MIASVSTFSRSIGATRPLCTRNGSMSRSFSVRQPAHVDEVAFDRRGRRHRRADQVGAAAGALAAFEVAVAGRGAALAGLEPVGVHRQAHRAAGLAPLEAGALEDLVEAFALGLLLHQPGARHHHRQLDVRRDACAQAAHDRRGLAQVLDARVGARADEHLVDADVGRSACSARAPCSSARAPSRRACSASFSRSGSGTRSSIDSTISGDVPQVTCGRDAARRRASTTASQCASASECSVRQ